MRGQVICIFALVACASAIGSGVGAGKVILGENANPGQFPYQVSLQWDGALVRSHTCGGAILNENWIITAAHCVVGTPTIGHFVIVAGDHDLKIIEGGEQEARVRFIIPHPDYPATSSVDANDIALIKLTAPLVFNENVSAINLPEDGVIPTGAAIVTGWGVSGGLILPTHPDVLQFAAITIEDVADCRSRFPDSQIFDTNFCSRGRVATCNEDDGSPLVRTHEDGTPELVGVVSWPTNPCGETTQPSVYTQVSKFIDFISRNIIN